MQRPRKEQYYLSIAEVVATRSTCLEKQYGCVIVKDDRIVSTGYNGSPIGRPNCCDLNICAKGEDKIKCVAVHAEQNALLGLARELSKDATLYLNCLQDTIILPCPICMNLIINARIDQIVVPNRGDSYGGYTFKTYNVRWQSDYIYGLKRNCAHLDEDGYNMEEVP